MTRSTPRRWSLALPLLAASLVQAQVPPRSAARLLMRRPLPVALAPALRPAWNRAARPAPPRASGLPLPPVPLRRSLTVRAAAPGPMVRIEVKASSSRLRSCGQCELSAGLKSGSQSLWRWAVEEPGGGTLSQDASGQIRYTAPQVSGRRTFHVRASSALDDRFFGRVAIEVRPNILMAVLDPSGPAPAAPALELVAAAPSGKPEEDGWAAVARFSRPHGVAFLPNTGQWLVSYPGNRLLVMAAEMGAAQDHRDLGAGTLCCPAQLAAQPGRGPLWWCAFAETELDQVGRLDARGVITVLAGEAGTHRLDPKEKHRDGGADQARFWAPEGLAMDRAGTVYVADTGNGALRRIQDGAVTTLLGLPHDASRHQWGNIDEGARLRLEAPLNGGLALDEEAGILYAGVGHSVLAVALAGERRGQAWTVLGDPARPGFEAWRADPPASLAGVPCLFLPRHLAFFRGRLYLSDHGNHAVRTYDPGTGQLRTLAGDPSQPVTRSGPLRSGSPHLDPGDAAALAYPAGIAFSDGGECRVATRDGVAVLSGLDA